MCIDIIKDLVDLVTTDHYHFVIKIFPAVLRTITHSIKSYAFFLLIRIVYYTVYIVELTIVAIFSLWKLN